jgi:hypothetical protein
LVLCLSFLGGVSASPGFSKVEEMVKKTSNPFGGWPPKPKRIPKPKNPFANPKAADTPAPRNAQFERLLCEAIKMKRIVSLRYSDDIAPRDFAPDVVYPSSRKKINVTGRLPQAIGEWEPHTFEVGKIKALSITERPFTPDQRFNLFDPKYRDRICPL